MIIEIKNLPQDRKIKHITFDITFEEDGSTAIKTTPVFMPDRVVTPVYGPIVQPVDPFQPPWNVTCTADSAQREHKDIPPEMTNVEF